MTPSYQGSYKRQIFQHSPRGKDSLVQNSHKLLTSSFPKSTIWNNRYVRPKTEYEIYHDKYKANINSREFGTPTERILGNSIAESIARKSYWKHQPRSNIGPSKWLSGKKLPQATSSLRSKDTVKKTTLSSNKRWTRNQAEHKKKKQFIVANWGGLGLGNGLAYGLAGTPAASYGTDLGTGITTGYGTGLGTILATAYGPQEANGVLDNRQTFGTNYETTATGNSQRETALSDLSTGALNPLSSQDGLSYLSALDSVGGRGTANLNSLDSISQYQNSDLDILGNSANAASLGTSAGSDGLDVLTGGTGQNQQYTGNNLGNSLAGKLAVGGGSRQGIGGCKFQWHPCSYILFERIFLRGRLRFSSILSSSFLQQVLANRERKKGKRPRNITSP